MLVLYMDELSDYINSMLCFGAKDNCMLVLYGGVVRLYFVLYF